MKDEKAAVKHDDKAENSENKKTEAEEDVVIVKDDEEETEKREVLIFTRSAHKESIRFVRKQLDSCHAFFFRRKITKKKT